MFIRSFDRPAGATRRRALFRSTVLVVLGAVAAAGLAVIAPGTAAAAATQKLPVVGSSNVICSKDGCTPTKIVFGPAKARAEQLYRQNVQALKIRYKDVATLSCTQGVGKVAVSRR